MNGDRKYRRLKDKLQENTPHRAFTVRIVRGVFCVLGSKYEQIKT
mgnify:CR=1|jgi:hypothetical protein